MRTEDVAAVAEYIKEAKEDHKGAIVFLGAGTSLSAGIPTASGIIAFILNKYKSNPNLRKLSDEDKKDYVKVMGCLKPAQRKKIFKNYVDKAKINLAHIYLAHLIKLGYVDYVLTTNFDDLMLRSLAMFNIFPPVHDLSVIEQLNTSAVDSGSIIYLHGRYNSIWQLNTKSELEKIRNICSTLFHSIKNRPWIFVGYSGNDPIFDHIIDLGRFDDGLYWVGYNNELPSQNVYDKLFANDESEAFAVQGYDADTFMLELHTQLEREVYPSIFKQPFSTLQTLLDSIARIDDREEFAPLKQLFDISQRQVKDAIGRYEQEKSRRQSPEAIEKDNIYREIIDIAITKDYDTTQLQDLQQRVHNLKDQKAIQMLTILLDDIH